MELTENPLTVINRLILNYTRSGFKNENRAMTTKVSFEEEPMVQLTNFPEIKSANSLKNYTSLCNQDQISEMDEFLIKVRMT